MLWRGEREGDAGIMPRRAFFRTLSGTFSKQQDSGSSEPTNDANLLKPRPPPLEPGGVNRRASFTARPRSKQPAAASGSGLDVRETMGSFLHWQAVRRGEVQDKGWLTRDRFLMCDYISEEDTP